jgi:hypothetical protein
MVGKRNACLVLAQMENEEYCRCKMEKRVLEGGEADAWATAQALPAYLKYVQDSGNKISKAQFLIGRLKTLTKQRVYVSVSHVSSFASTTCGQCAVLE